MFDTLIQRARDRAMLTQAGPVEVTARPNPMPRAIPMSRPFPWRRFPAIWRMEDREALAMRDQGLSGFWDDISSGIGQVVSSAAPAFLQIELAKQQARAQGNALTVAGSTLYTPQNLATLQMQGQYEMLQRSNAAAAATNQIIPGVSPWVLLAGVVGLGSVLFLASRKK